MAAHTDSQHGRSSGNREQTFRSIILEGEKQQRYGKGNQQRLLCEVTKENAIDSAGSIEEYLGKVM